MEIPPLDAYVPSMHPILAQIFLVVKSLFKNLFHKNVWKTPGIKKHVPPPIPV
jgi:hypothetical protein